MRKLRIIMAVVVISLSLNAVACTSPTAPDGNVEPNAGNVEPNA